MQFIKNLWKTQPNTVLGASAGFILLAFFGSISVYNSMTAEPPKPRVLTPQEVVDEYEFQMRRVCKEQIQLKLDTPEPYKVQKIKFTPHTMNTPASAVVDLRVNFIGRKDGNISTYFSRCSFNSSGRLVRYPNIVK